MKSIQNINLWTKHSYLRKFEYNNGVVSSHKSEDGKCNGQAKQDQKKKTIIDSQNNKQKFKDL